MYIHLGSDVVISTQNLIAIVNIEKPLSADIQDILDIATEERKLINISDKDKKKALVICDDCAYISPISSNTLYKRANNYYKEV